MRQTLLGKFHAQKSQISRRCHTRFFLEFGFEIGERVSRDPGKRLQRRFFHEVVAHILDAVTDVFIYCGLVSDRRHIFESEEKTAEELHAGADRFLIKTGKEIEGCPQQLNMRAPKLEPVFTQRGQLFLYSAESIIQLQAVFSVQTEKMLRILNIDLN